MWPLLISLGPVQVQTISLFYLLCLVASLFVIWRKAREEHYAEDEVFDGLLVSAAAGVVAGRAAFVVLHFTQFGFNPLQWLALFSRPGSVGIVAVLVAGAYLYRFAQRSKWDELELLDFSVVGLSAGLFFISLGQFFDGSVFGVATELPWGVVFPGVLEKHHPTQLYAAVFYLLLWKYLSWVEYRYRTFQWYRGGKNTAQTGFLVSVFLMSFGAFSALLSLIRPSAVVIYGVGLDVGLYLALVIAGAWLLAVRAHRLSWGKGGIWQHANK